LKYRRKLFIEAGYGSFTDKLDKYFILPSYISAKKIDFIQYPASVYPPNLKNDLYNYETIQGPYAIKIKDGPYLHFDINKSYDEQYLIYQNYGGGEQSIDFFKRVKLKEDLRLHISSQIKKLGVYSAVHIRNTDYQTNYKSFLGHVRDNLIHDVVVCTDSFEVQQYCKYLFGDKLILPTSIPDLGGNPLHTPTQDIDGKYKTNVDAITDLFILACSVKLYITNVTCDTEYFKVTEAEAVFSGYSLLALNLHKRKGLVKRLLSGR
jgi:hypothetical protein